MQTTSLTALVHQHLTFAREASSGRSSHTVYGGHEHTLRQTLIALASGQHLDEREPRRSHSARPPRHRAPD